MREAAGAALVVVFLISSFPASGHEPPSQQQSPTTADWRVEGLRSFGGSSPPPVAVDSRGRPHVLACPPGEVWYGIRGTTDWGWELVAETVAGGVCGKLTLGPDDRAHITFPPRVGDPGQMYAVNDGGTWRAFPAPFPVGDLSVDPNGIPFAAGIPGPPQQGLLVASFVSGSWTTVLVDSFLASSVMAHWESIRFGPDRQPRVLYYAETITDVRYAFRDPSGWHVEVVDRADNIGRVGRGGQLAMLSDGTPAAVYGTGLGPIDVRYSVRDPTGWTSEVVDDTATFLVHPTLAVGLNDEPCLAYEWIQEVDQAKIIWDQDLLFRCRTGPGWTREVIIDGRVDDPQDIAVFAQFPDLKSDRCGNPHLAFYYNLRVGADDSGKGVYYATKGDPCEPDLVEPIAQKQQAIDRTKVLKERALDRRDWRFVNNLDDAEYNIWRSLGYASPFHPTSISVTFGVDVSVAWTHRDHVDLVVGSSWTPRLPAYRTLRMSFGDGDVVNVDLPDGWPRRPLRFADSMWVDGWEQDLSIESKRNGRTGFLSLKIHVREVSLGFTLSLDADPVAALSFSYEVRPWWTDGAHLDPRHGHRVFDLEREAASCLVASVDSDGGHDGEDGEGDDRGGAGARHDASDHDGRRVCGDRDEDDDDDDDDEDDGRGSPGPRAVHCRLDPHLWTKDERAALDAECAAVADRLVAADEGLSRIAFEEAKDGPVRNPKNQEKVDRELGRAERDLEKAQAAWDHLDFGDAIRYFEDAWEHAQRAISLARR